MAPLFNAGLFERVLEHRHFTEAVTGDDAAIFAIQVVGENSSTWYRFYTSFQRSTSDRMVLPLVLR